MFEVTIVSISSNLIGQKNGLTNENAAYNWVQVTRGLDSYRTASVIEAIIVSVA